MADPEKLWSNRAFRRLYAAHATSLVGSGLGVVALGLLAHELVGASAPTVLGVTLTIRIAVIVLLSPCAGVVAGRLGIKRSLIACDLLRVLVMLGFLAADHVWQIYTLAFLLNAGSALFTPIYKATIPSVVAQKDYPRALAWGTAAYDASNILGPAVAGLVIALVGFEGNFILNACASSLSAWLLFGLPRLALEKRKEATSTAIGAWAGITAMLSRWPLRLTLLLALQTSIAGAFVLVGTIGRVKSELALSDASYAWLMATYGAGSVMGAFIYAKRTPLQSFLRHWVAAAMVGALLIASTTGGYFVLFPALAILGAGQAILGICGNEILARSSGDAERTSVFAAHFALSHAGWGIFYPLAGWLVSWIGYNVTAGIFAIALTGVSLPLWIYQLWIGKTHRDLPDANHTHVLGSEVDPTHDHQHGTISHRHFHLHY